MKPPSPPAPPESFVVRIYRRDARAPARVTGTVELVGVGKELSFKNLRELQRILSRQGDAADSRPQRGTAS